MQNYEYNHTPVLLNEVLSLLDPKPGQNVIDATLGGGGYTREIIERIKPDGKVLAIDLDKDAIDYVKGQTSSVKGLITHHGNFAKIDRAVKEHNFPAPEAIVADI